MSVVDELCEGVWLSGDDVEGGGGGLELGLERLQDGAPHRADVVNILQPNTV